MYAGFLMHRPATNSTASILFDTHMVSFIEDSKRILATCETMLENPEVKPEDIELVNSTVQKTAIDLAKKIELVTREFRKDGWAFHSLISQD
jgi:hypothetical protein